MFVPAQNPRRMRSYPHIQSAQVGAKALANAHKKVCAKHAVDSNGALECCPTKDWQNYYFSGWCINLQVGRPCAHDWQCETYNCVEGRCAPRPLPGETDCEDIKNSYFNKIARKGCDINKIAKPQGEAYTDYTHCYRDECTTANNRDFAIRQECACRNMYFTGKFKNCGAYYYSGQCKAYPSMSDSSSLLQTGGGTSRKISGNYKMDDKLPPNYPDVISYHPEKEADLINATFKDATKKLGCIIPRKKFDEEGRLVWQEWDCKYLNNSNLTEARS